MNFFSKSLWIAPAAFTMGRPIIAVSFGHVL
jgi:hypothetical protein